MKLIVTITAGALMRGAVRNLVNEMKFHGYDIEMMENKGWLESDFKVKGDIHTIETFKRHLNKIA
jgi:hypothetical protein